MRQTAVVSDGNSNPKPGVDVRVGRVRPPTAQELADEDSVLQPGAVLEVKEHDEVLPPPERHLVGFIDGFRPVARVRRRCGLSPAEFMSALSSIAARGLLTLKGVIEETDDASFVYGEDEIEGTLPRGMNDVIPPHVMREIQAMIDEEVTARHQERLPDDPGSFEHQATTEVEIPDKD